METNYFIHKNIRITGRVQGVGFRYSARNAAKSLGIYGYVKNLPNGEVYIEAEGPLASMESFIQWCHEGPPRAIIQLVDVYEGELRRFSEFIIK